MCWVGIQRGEIIPSFFYQRRFIQSIIDRYFDASLHLVLTYFALIERGFVYIFLHLSIVMTDGLGWETVFEIETGTLGDIKRRRD